MIPDDYVKETCKIGQGEETCAFLMMGAEGFECAKDNEPVRMIVQIRLDAGTMSAQGDNCDGWKKVNDG